MPSLVFDMVYNPLETPLLKLAQSRGLAVISGMEMFVQTARSRSIRWSEEVTWPLRPSPVDTASAVYRTVSGIPEPYRYAAVRSGRRARAGPAPLARPAVRSGEGRGRSV